MKQKVDVKSFILTLLKSPKLHAFYPTVVAKKTCSTLSQVENILEEMSLSGLVQKEFELMCPGCYRVLDRIIGTEQFKEDVSCYICGECEREQFHTHIRYLKVEREKVV